MAFYVDTRVGSVPLFKFPVSVQVRLDITYNVSVRHSLLDCLTCTVLQFSDTAIVVLWLCSVSGR